MKSAVIWITKMLCWAAGLIALGLIFLHPLLPEWFNLPIANITVPTKSIFQLAWASGVVPFANFIDRHIDGLFTWPVAIAFVSYLLLKSGLLHTLIPSTAGRIKSFGAFGFSVELSEQIKALQRESDDIFRLLPSVRNNISSEIRLLIKDMNIESTFPILMMKVFAKLRELNSQFDPSKCRATIHIEDPLLSEHLMQLLEYVSDGCTFLPGRKAGRPFSVRRGIVGRAWRSHIPEISGVLPTPVAEGEEIKFIAQIWGMTQDEAKQAAKYPSYVSIPFCYGKDRNAVFYMDSTLKKAFVEDGKQKDDLIEFVKQTIGKLRLASAIGDLDSRISARALKLNILES